MASFVEKLRDQRRKEKLAREYSHPGYGYMPTKEEISQSIDVGLGRLPTDIAYGEQGLQAPAVAGGLVSLDPTDYLSGSGLAKLAAMAKVGGAGLASLAGGMTAINKLGAQSVPRMFGQSGSLSKGIKLPYQIEHKPMTVEGGASRLHDLTGSFGDDIYGRNAIEYFGSGDDREKFILNQLKAVRGKPDAMVTIYRGVPADAKGINAGDWVTLHPGVAKDYADLLKEQGTKGKVVKMQVPASSITSWPDSLLEFGYYPK